MKVLISWSGEKSKAVASALRDWIPNVIQVIEPWMSDSDIDAGKRWNHEVADALATTKFGIICLTKSNLTAPWILFETGALAKTLTDTYVCPYLIDMKPGDIPQGPLAQFQGKRADKDGTKDLILTINGALPKEALQDTKLLGAFEKWWPDLEAVLDDLPSIHVPQEVVRSPDDKIDEILNIVRGLSRRSAEDSESYYAKALNDALVRGEIEGVSGTTNYLGGSRPPIAVPTGGAHARLNALRAKKVDLNVKKTPPRSKS